MILKGKDAEGKTELKFHECVPEEGHETQSDFEWFGGKKQHGSFVPKPSKDGKIHLENLPDELTEDVLDLDSPIEYNWHTHPPGLDAEPSTADGKLCERNDIVGVVVTYIGRSRGGKIIDDWIIWIVDVDGKAYEYKPPLPAKK